MTDNRGVPQEPVFRRATVEDLVPAAGVFNRAQNELHAQFAIARVDRAVEVFTIPQAHVLAHDPDRCHVAVVDGLVAGYTSAIVRDDAWYFSALFVDPSAQGGGIGQRLFQLAAAGWPARRMTITEAIQPVSNAIYARQGLFPSTPILEMGGRARIDAPTDVRATTPRPGELARLDALGYGFDRAVDHEFWGRHAELTLWRRRERPIAYAYVSPTGTIGPLVGRDPASAATALRAELARRSEVDLEIPGSAPALVAVALEAGLRFVEAPGLLLHSVPVRPPSAVVISGFWLL